jgi:predicted ester cyclase
MENTERMVALDDAWNAQDVAEVAKYHKPDVIVYWPGQPPTRGMDDHRTEATAFFTTFPDQHLENRPYKVLFGAGDWTCSMARFTGTMKGAMGGTAPTGKSFDVDFCTVAHWDGGQISEEYLFYDLVTL